MEYIFTIRFLLALPVLVVAALAILVYETISGIKFDPTIDL